MIETLIDALGVAADHALLFLQRWWLLLVVTALAIKLPPARRLIATIGRFVDRLASRPIVASCLIVSASLMLSIGVAAVGGVPLPLIQDDQAVLLGGKMFASGYAAYPTHPLWQHFETVHVLQKPSYAPKYPAGQSLILAFGIVLFGVPLAGSWIAAAAACVAIYWAVRALVAERWAFLAGLGVAIHPTMLDWAESYHGGSLPALGGALLFGAVVRMTRDRRASLGWIAGTGLMLLAISRPYEGVVLALGCAIAFVIATRAFPSVGAVAMAAVVVLIGFGGMAMHNRAITGSITTLPWNAYARQYDPAPPFAWQTAGPAPHYHSEEMRFVHETMLLGQYRRLHAEGGVVRELDKKIGVLGGAFFGNAGTEIVARLWPLFLAPLFFFPSIWREGRFAILVVAIFLLAPLSLTGWLLTHYIAPVTAAAAALYALLFRAVTRWRPWLGVVVAIVFVINSGATFRMWLTRDRGLEATRQELVAAAGTGRHLFLVAPNVHGMIYNEPEIDRAPVVWARDLGDNARLLAHFRGRTVWRISNEWRGRPRLQRLP